MIQSSVAESEEGAAPLLLNFEVYQSPSQTCDHLFRSTTAAAAVIKSFGDICPSLPPFTIHV